MPLIVLEGLDGAGKSTQVQLLSNYYNKKGNQVFTLHFPRLQEPVWGEMIAAFLRGEYGNINQVHPQLIAMLYAGDRWAASHLIQEKLNQNYVVILDRYVYSNLAYQCAKIENPNEKKHLRDWIVYLEYQYFKIPKPDINIFLDVPLHIINQMLNEKRTGTERNYLKGKQDIHEKDLTFQEKVRNEYLVLCKKYGLKYIDCSNNNNTLASIEEVFKRICNVIVNFC